MSYISTKGVNPQGSPVSLPVSGQRVVASSTLAANEVWDSGWLSVEGFESVLYVIRSDAPSATGGVTIDYSNDNGTTVIAAGIARTYSQQPNLFQSALVPKGRFIRLNYKNGSTAQTSFYLEIRLSTATVQNTMSSLNVPTTDTNLASVVKGPIEMKDSANGSYDQVYRTGNSMNVNITGGAPSTDTSTLATSANQTTLNTATGSRTDAAVTDPAASASVIALLKGLLQESVAQASTGSFTAYTLAANVAQTIPASGNGKGRIISSVNGTVLVGVGFTATASNWSYRVVTNGTVEIRPEWGALAVSLFSTTASTVNVTVMS